VSFNLEGEIKTFQDKDKLKQFMSTKPHYKEYSKEYYTWNRMRSNHKYKRPGKNKSQGEFMSLQELGKQQA
jgi:hypothetical protein